MLGVDVQVTNEGDVVIGVVRKISHNMAWCSAFVLGVETVDVQVPNEGDVVIGAVRR